MANARRIVIEFLGKDTSVGKTSDEVASKVKKTGDAAEKAGPSFDGLGDKIKGFATGVAATFGGLAIGELFSQAMDFKAGNAKLTAELGLTKTESANTGKVAGELFSQNYGDSMGQVQQAIGSVIQNIDGMRTANKSTLEDISMRALNTANIFDQDLGGVTKAVSQMLRTGLAKNAKEAFDIITVGFQQGANKSDDFLDTLNEYGTQFRKLGLNGKQATGLISQGLKAGARDSDLVADAIKEFSIRAVDGSKTTAEGFKAIGLNAKDMAEQIGKGGPQARKGLDTVLDRLRKMKDPVKQAAAATELFGTQSEDLGKALFALDPSKAVGGLGKVAGAADKANKAFNDTPTAKMQAFFREMQGGAIKILGGEVIPKLEEVGKLFQKNQEWLVPLLVTVGTMIALQKAWAVTQGVLNAVMAANPIGLLVLAIAGLAAGIIYAYKHSEKFREVVNGVFSWLGSAVTNTINFVRSHWRLILGILTGPIGAAAILIVSNFGKIKSAGTSVVNWVKDIPGKLKALGQNFADAGKHLIGKFVDGMKNAAGIIGGIAGNVWSTVKKLLNKAIDKINSALEFKISLPGPDISINPPNIPHLAKGGIVRARPGGTLALLGEAGRDEAVVPLGGPASRRASGGGGDIHIHINGALDPNAVAKQLEQILTKYARSTGRRLAFV